MEKKAEKYWNEIMYLLELVLMGNGLYNITLLAVACNRCSMTMNLLLNIMACNCALEVLTHCHPTLGMCYVSFRPRNIELDAFYCIVCCKCPLMSHQITKGICVYITTMFCWEHQISGLIGMSLCALVLSWVICHILAFNIHLTVL